MRITPASAQDVQMLPRRLLRSGACIALAVLPLLASPAHGQTSPAPAVEVPQPAALAANWWDFLDVGPAELAERARRIQEMLGELKSKLLSEKLEALTGLFDEINQYLDGYVALMTRQPEPAAVRPPLPERFSLAGFLELAARLHEAEVELDLERADNESQENAVNAARRQYDDLKAAYLAQDATAESRLRQGLVLMRDRLRLALAQRQLTLHTPLVAVKEDEVQRLTRALGAASERIDTDATEEARYRNAAREAEQQASTIRDEATFARLRSQIYLSDSPRDRDRARLQIQLLREYDVRIAQAELEVLRARLSLALVRYLFDPNTAFDEADTPQATLQALSRFLDDLESRLRGWREATDKERAAAEAQLALSEGADAASAEIQRARIAKADQTLRSILRLRQQIVLARALSRTAVTHIAEEEGRLTAWWQLARNEFYDGLKAALGLASTSLVTVNDTPITLLGLVRVAVILTIAWWISKLLRQFLDRTSRRRQTMNRASMYTLGRLFHYLILALGLLIALSSIGIDVTKFALLLSAIGIGLGFGLQAIFSNFVAGLIILFEKSLKVGDFVDLESGVRGEVREINIRSTLITTNDNVDILVPNSEFVNGRVTNWTLRDHNLRLRIPFGTAYGVDKEQVKKAGLEAALAVSHTTRGHGSREPQVWVVGFGESRLDFELVVWLTPDAVRRPNAVNAAYYWALETALRKYGVEIALPQRVLHLGQGFGEVRMDPLRDDPKTL